MDASIIICFIILKFLNFIITNLKFIFIIYIYNLYIICCRCRHFKKKYISKNTAIDKNVRKRIYINPPASAASATSIAATSVAIAETTNSLQHFPYHPLSVLPPYLIQLPFRHPGFLQRIPQQLHL